MRRRVRPIYQDTFVRRRRWLIAGVVICVLAVIIALIAWWQLRNPRPNTKTYPVLGVRISQTDGTQDYTKLQKVGVQFVYLKATEGASYFDDNFATNYSQAQGSDMRVGVYHYFSFTSTPTRQAAAFFKNVGNDIGDLPIGVEVSAYTTVPSTAKLTKKLTAFVSALRIHYDAKVMLIGTQEMLAKVKTVSPDAPRMVISSSTRAGKKGTFWQYATAAKIPGGDGSTYRTVVFTNTQSSFDGM